jgi:hypothetical protein
MAPDGEATVRLWPREAVFVNVIVTFPAFVVSEVVLNISDPSGLAAIVRAWPAPVVVAAGAVVAVVGVVAAELEP